VPYYPQIYYEPSISQSYVYHYQSFLPSYSLDVNTEEKSRSQLTPLEDQNLKSYPPEPSTFLEVPKLTTESSSYFSSSLESQSGGSPSGTILDNGNSVPTTYTGDLQTLDEAKISVENSARGFEISNSMIEKRIPASITEIIESEVAAGQIFQREY